jgi:hypothetical protein
MITKQREVCTNTEEAGAGSVRNAVLTFKIALANGLVLDLIHQKVNKFLCWASNGILLRGSSTSGFLEEGNYCTAPLGVCMYRERKIIRRNPEISTPSWSCPLQPLGNAMIMVL